MTSRATLNKARLLMLADASGQVSQFFVISMMQLITHPTFLEAVDW